jgi:phosphopantetheinyl transferase (holo-ACP synthase)
MKMRTYILAMFNKQTKKYTRYQCQAFTFKEAVAKAQEALNGFPGLVDNGKGVGNASLHA